MPSTSPRWSHFRLESFGEPYLVWHDGPDFSTLDVLWRSNPSFVEHALLDGLGQHDPLAAQSIARLPLGDAARDRFVTILRDHVGRHPVGYHLQVAHALSRLTGDESWAREILRVLLGAGFWNDRFDAAILLASYRPTPEIVAGLAACVQDPDYLVRYHASNTLLVYAGLAPDVTAHEYFFSRIRSRSTAAEWAEVAEGLAGAVLMEIHG